MAVIAALLTSLAGLLTFANFVLLPVAILRKREQVFNFIRTNPLA
jgi:hypothetical protein